VSRELVVDAGAATERLDVFLAAALGESRSRVTRRLKAGDVTMGGVPARPSYLIQPGDRIVVAAEESSPPALRPVPDLPVVYEDADLLVIDKPAGLAAHPGAGLKPTAPTVAEFARGRTTDPDSERPGIVHRLDQDTSGLMIIAKTPAAKTYLQQAFHDHAVHKTYLLLAVGRLDPPQAVIKLPLDRDPAHPLRRAVVPTGRPAVTRYRTIADYPGFSLVEARPETGRTHQLRVHFAALGHPIAGDKIYGVVKNRAAQPLKLRRQFLHAAGLEFTTPTGAHINVHSPLPPDLAGVVQTLGERL
jgi:23S rRNA pseudouridine1911/1915/1917 synthase